MLDIKQLKEELHLSERSIFRLIQQGKLRGFKIGREWRFERDDIAAYIENQKQEAAREQEQKKRKNDEQVARELETVATYV